MTALAGTARATYLSQPLLGMRSAFIDLARKRSDLLISHCFFGDVVVSRRVLPNVDVIPTRGVVGVGL
jgi:hypothetical protein